MSGDEQTILRLDDLTARDASSVGGKAANLGEMGARGS